MKKFCIAHDRRKKSLGAKQFVPRIVIQGCVEAGSQALGRSTSTGAAGAGIPWMVNLCQDDLMDGFGRLAIEGGSHVRVGIEDYGEPRTPRNEELVAEIAELGRSLGRPPAPQIDAARILGTSGG